MTQKRTHHRRHRGAHKASSSSSLLMPQVCSLLPVDIGCSRRVAFFHRGWRGLEDYLSGPEAEVTDIITTTKHCLEIQAQVAEVLERDDAGGGSHPVWHLDCDVLERSQELKQSWLAGPLKVSSPRYGGKGLPAMVDVLDVADCLARVEVKVWKEEVLQEGPFCFAGTNTDERSSSLILALDHIHDPRNMGAILRSAAFYGIRLLLIPKNRQVGLTAAAVRCARGGLGYVKVVEVVNLARTLAELRRHQWRVLGADEKGGSLDEIFWRHGGPVVLVLGGEDKGISMLVRRTCDSMVGISAAVSGPSSLNVSVAAGILMDQLARYGGG